MFDIMNDFFEFKQRLSTYPDLKELLPRKQLEEMNKEFNLNPTEDLYPMKLSIAVMSSLEIEEEMLQRFQANFREISSEISDTPKEIDLPSNLLKRIMIFTNSFLKHVYVSVTEDKEELILDSRVQVILLTLPYAQAIDPNLIKDIFKQSFAYPIEPNCGFMTFYPLIYTTISGMLSKSSDLTLEDCVFTLLSAVRISQIMILAFNTIFEEIKRRDYQWIAENVLFKKS
ncbi:MAG: hypothetical protein ACTSRP_01855 [Candidatus Helarchaeota archaeon]